MSGMMIGMMGMMKGGGLPSLPGMGPVKGWRQAKGNPSMPGLPGAGGKKPKKGKKKGPFGGGFF